MNVNLEHYRVFYIVAREKNISEAANKLYISQPAISQMIRKLEQELNCTLFIRNKHGVTLTEEGVLLYQGISKAMGIIETTEDKMAEIGTIGSGIINIGTNDGVAESYLLDFLKIFNEKYPKIRVNITINTTDNLISMARDGLVDLIIKKVPNVIPDDFDKINLYKIRDCFMASDKFKELKGKSISIKELANYPIIAINKASRNRIELDGLCRKNGIEFTPYMQCSSIGTVEEYTVNGFGIGYLSYEHIKNSNRDKLFEVDVIENKPIHKQICLLTYSGRNQTNFIISFINLLKDYFESIS